MLPNSGLMKRWDPLVMFLLVFVALVTPVEIAFELKSDALEGLNWGITFAFMFDMCLQFFLAFDNGIMLVLSNKARACVRVCVRVCVCVCVCVCACACV